MCLNMGYSHSLEDYGMTAFCENIEAKHIELIEKCVLYRFLVHFVKTILSRPGWMGSSGVGTR